MRDVVIDVQGSNGEALQPRAANVPRAPELLALLREIVLRDHSDPDQRKRQGLPVACYLRLFCALLVAKDWLYAGLAACQLLVLLWTALAPLLPGIG